ncbi:MAG: YggT family protein [bacterium]|nr:YggT family protein [bacterium]
MDVVAVPLLRLLMTVIDLYVMALIISVILSWLVSFGIVNSYNRFVTIIGEFLYRITEPFLAPLRRILPNLGGLDLSPLVLILVCYLAKDVIVRIALKFSGL